MMDKRTFFNLLSIHREYMTVVGDDTWRIYLFDGWYRVQKNADIEETFATVDEVVYYFLDKIGVWNR